MFLQLFCKRLCLLLFVVIQLLVASAAISHDEDPDQKAILLTDTEQAWLDKNYTVRVRITQWPPFMIIDGNVHGIAIEYLEKIFDQHDISYTYIPSSEVSWKEALEFIRRHEIVDMVPTAKITEERKKYILFTDEYLFLPWVIFTRTDSQFVSSIGDMTDQLVCVPEGYVMHDLLKSEYPGINLHVVRGVNPVEQCVQLLSTGIVDGYVGNLAVATYIVQSKGYNNIKVAAPTPFGNHNQAMGVRDDWPELVSIINKTLKTFTPEEHAEIRNKWLSVRYEYGIGPFQIFMWILGVTAVFSGVVILVMTWNRRLNREITVRHQVEDLLRQSEDKYRTLSDAAFEGIILVKKNQVIEANRRMAEMLQYNYDELPGMPVELLIEKSEREKVLKRFAENDTSLYESVGLCRDGSTIPVEIQSKYLPYKKEDVLVTAVRDISQRKKAEEELKILRGILPICSFCKKIRNDDGYWQQVDVYIYQHSEADISHSLCPDCMAKYYGNYDKK